MSEPSEPREPKKPQRPTAARIAVWVVAGGIGLYLLISGLVGVLGGGK